MRRHRPRFAALLALLLPLLAQAEPKWEAGVVAGGGWLHDYPGADQAQRRGLVAPLLIYRGPVLRVDREGIRGRIIDHPDVEFDISASAAFNARENEARAGMPPLDYLFGLGPQLAYEGWRDAFGSPVLYLRARALASTDFRRRADARGAMAGAELRWSFTPRLAGVPLNISAGVQPTWASRALHGYFYGVEAAQATAERPAHRARAGYLGTELNLTASRELSESLSWFAGVRAMSLHGAANADSPLHRRSSSVGVGVGLVWTPWRSDMSASD